MTLITPRLRIDALCAADAAALFAYRGDCAVARWQGWQPATLAEAAAFIARQRDAVVDAPGAWWQRALRRRGDGALVGDLGLHFRAGAEVELGITLAPAAQGHGLAAEALTAMLDFAFGPLGKRRAWAATDPLNAPCRRLLHRLGMRQADPVPALLPPLGAAGDVAYALSAATWRMSRSTPSSGSG